MISSLYSTLRTERAIERATVCVLWWTAVVGLHNQDLRIATEAWDQGCGLIIVVNKWTGGGEDANTATGVRKADHQSAVPSLRTFIYVSALSGSGSGRFSTHPRGGDGRDRRIPTAEVNKVLATLLERPLLPETGEEVKLLYASQIGRRADLRHRGNRRDVPELSALFSFTGSLRWPFTGCRCVFDSPSEVAAMTGAMVPWLLAPMCSGLSNQLSHSASVRHIDLREQAAGISGRPICTAC